jgi:methyl-accepting chemotaxis protein
MFALAGVGMALAPFVIFLLTGVLRVQGDVTFGDVMLGVGLSLFLLGSTGAFLLLALRSFNRPVKRMLNGIVQIAEGNLSPDLPGDAPAEFGLINDALVAMCEQMRTVIVQLGGLSKRVVHTTDGAGESFTEVQEGINIQSGVASRTFDAVGRMADGLLAASTGIKEMADRIESSASQVSQMDLAIGRVAGSVGGLNSIIEEASRSTKEGDENVRLLARDIADLTAQVQTADSALVDMVTGAEKARADANDTAYIMGNLNNETERIGAAIEATIEGSDAVHLSNERILQVTESLRSRVDRVDDVLDAVHNLAERTKLLSINASIIASEAGEHGRAFAVVAREVKELAQSTATAIAEISAVLEGLKQGFEQTAETIRNGQEEVDRSIRMARNAVVLLRNIPDKVHQAAALSTEIAAKNADQVEEGAEVKRIIDRVVTTMHRVTELLSEQLARNGHTLTLFNTINLTAEKVLKSTSDHAGASSEINSKVESISGDFRALAVEVRENVSGLKTIVDLSEEVLTISDKNRRRAEELTALIGDLNRYALDLGEDSFRLSTDSAE